MYPINRLRLFREGRLSPWEPEHSLWIKQELATLQLEDPEDAERFRKLYEDKAAEHEGKSAPVVEVQERETVTGTVEVEPTESVEEPVTIEIKDLVTEAPKKRGRKPSNPIQ